MTARHPAIVIDPAVLAGKPVVRGTRLSVEFIIGLMADGWTEADILTRYPGIVHEDIVACLQWKADQRLAFVPRTDDLAGIARGANPDGYRDRNDRF